MKRAVRFLLALLPVVSGQALAADRVAGTMTVKGTAIKLQHVSASLQQDPDDPQSSWLVLLLSDVEVAPGDRGPARLAELAGAGELSAVRVVWAEGADQVFATPYQQRLAASGRRGLERPTIELERYDGRRFEGTVKAKMLGQDWFFQASVKAAVTPGGALELEPAVAESEPGPGTDDPRLANRTALARMGYEVNPDSLTSAIADGNVEAVKLLLACGLSPEAPDAVDNVPLIFAVSTCTRNADSALGMVRTLLAAGAKVNVTDDNGSTPLIWACQACGVDLVRLLVDSGADVNARAKGGATPLMMATAMSNAEVVDLLRAAGAHE